MLNRNVLDCNWNFTKSDQNVHAVDAHNGHKWNAYAANKQACILEGVGNGEDASADVAFQQVDQCFEISAIEKEHVTKL